MQYLSSVTVNLSASSDLYVHLFKLFLSWKTKQKKTTKKILCSLEWVNFWLLWNVDQGHHFFSFFCPPLSNGCAPMLAYCHPQASIILIVQWKKAHVALHCSFSGFKNWTCSHNLCLGILNMLLGILNSLNKFSKLLVLYGSWRKVASSGFPHDLGLRKNPSQFTSYNVLNSMFAF